MGKKAQVTNLIDQDRVSGIRLTPQWKVAEDVFDVVRNVVDPDIGPTPLIPGYDQRVCARTVNVQVQGMEKVRAVTIDLRHFNTSVKDWQYLLVAQMGHEYKHAIGAVSTGNTGGRHSDGGMNDDALKSIGLTFKAKSTDSHGHVHPVISKKFRAWVDETFAELGITAETFIIFQETQKPKAAGTGGKRVKYGCAGHIEVDVTSTKATEMDEAEILCGACDTLWQTIA